ncbi:MAG: nitroreductase family deazaflavin-dependent oxidoreductase [Acidimicrobiia bacterium]|jgi:deazaflavin-dependent oxidoreductase (nitroreductase family)
MSDNPAGVPNWTPPGWLNQTMTAMLKTPGLQRLVGRGTALITFTGRKSGRRITTPVSYVERDDRILITGHRTRQWWRNLLVDPKVEIRLAGKVRNGLASVMDDPDNALADFLALLEAQPVVAKISGVPIDDQGRVDPSKAREVLGHTVVVSIKLEEEDSRQE